MQIPTLGFLSWAALLTQKCFKTLGQSEVQVNSAMAHSAHTCTLSRRPPSTTGMYVGFREVRWFHNLSNSPKVSGILAEIGEAAFVAESPTAY